MKTHLPAFKERFQAESRTKRPLRMRIGFWLLLAIAAFYLLTEHRAHLALGLPYLPLLLLAACPLIHLFGHGGHGGHGHHPHDVDASPRNDAEPGAPVDTTSAEHRHGGRLL